MARMFVRSVSVRRLLDNLFVAAVGTVLVIRAFLFVTGYPIIGGETLHIAHMLWGGFFMIAAIIILVSFLGQRVQHFAAILGGIGFGFFIDELGKFITQDNNYFFQPTIMLIYLVFVAMYFITRELERTLELSEEERLVNALELSKEAVMKRFDEVERVQMLALLAGEHKSQKSLFEYLGKLLNETELLPVVVWWPRQRLREWYLEFVESKYFTPFVVALLILQTGLVIASLKSFGDYQKLGYVEQTIVWIGIASATLAVLYVLRGLYALRLNRLAAFQKLYRANLIAILLTQPFAFYVATFVPLIALAINLAALFTLQFLIDQEKKRAAVK